MKNYMKYLDYYKRDKNSSNMHSTKILTFDQDVCQKEVNCVGTSNHILNESETFYNL